MGEASKSSETAKHLLEVKQRLGYGPEPSDLAQLSSDGSDVEPADGTPSARPAACVNCAYSQRGQSVDRCPECGLLLASQLRDPTPWSTGTLRPRDWWETACKIWIWDRRIRIRTAMVPATPQSLSFAKWSIAMSAPLLGFALAVLNWNPKAPPMLQLSCFMLQLAVGSVCSAGVLGFWLYGSRFSIRGVWRRELRFVPSSIDYATAWWPPLCACALLVSSFSGMGGPDTNVPGWLWMPLLALASWGFWLWGSVTESQHIRNTAVRITAVMLCMAFAGGFLMLLVPGGSRMIIVSLMRPGSSSSIKLNVFGTYSLDPVRRGPRTYALVIDMIPSDDETIVADQLTKLGAEKNCVELRGNECTPKRIREALQIARSEVKPEDKFILYINGHGAPTGSGAIQIADGFLTSQSLAEQVAQFPTKHCLVVVDSCFGGKFIPALRSSGCNAVVIASTDDRNVAFRTGLLPFWKALGRREADRNGDGRVAVDEAFWFAFLSMLNAGEQARVQGVVFSEDLALAKVLAVAGFSTPQLEALGSAEEQDFSVPAAPPVTSASPSPP